jgi:hypothetical protein
MWSGSVDSVDTPRHFGGIVFLQDHKEGDIQKIEALALRGWKNNFSEGVMSRL